jgi:hypothetical protein
MDAGLCDSCQHQKVVTSGKGSRFSLCGLAATDARFAKYPPLPVWRCPGHAPRPPAPPAPPAPPSRGGPGPGSAGS